MNKSFLVLFSFVLTSTAFAETTDLLRCSTDGSALAEVRIQSEDGGHSAALIVQFEETSEDDTDTAPPLRLPVRSGLKDLITDTSTTILAAKNSVTKSGGAFYGAALLRVVEGKKRAFLSLYNNVYILHCY
jgi:predicted outer membrane repeat protein